MRIRSCDVVIDTDRRQLLRDGREIVLSPKAFQLLLLLADARPKALSKSVLYEALWPDTFVVEANLSNLVGEIRHALGDSAQQARYVRTLHGFGYAFCAEEEGSNVAAALEPPAGYLVLADGRLFTLVAGENVVGRGHDVQLRLDLPGISRRHARIRIGDGAIVVEDLGSKNGTFLNDAPVDGAVAVASGDVIGLGSTQLTFHLAGAEASTETMPREPE
jgi:DNA-binding winged helix-turn-helix (wHTH) protein